MNTHVNNIFANILNFYSNPAIAEREQNRRIRAEQLEVEATLDSLEDNMTDIKTTEILQSETTTYIGIPKENDNE